MITDIHAHRIIFHPCLLNKYSYHLSQDSCMQYPRLLLLLPNGRNEEAGIQWVWFPLTKTENPEKNFTKDIVYPYCAISSVHSPSAALAHGWASTWSSSRHVCFINTSAAPATPVLMKEPQGETLGNTLRPHFHWHQTFHHFPRHMLVCTFCTYYRTIDVSHTTTKGKFFLCLFTVAIIREGLASLQPWPGQYFSRPWRLWGMSSAITPLVLTAMVIYPINFHLLVQFGDGDCIWCTPQHSWHADGREHAPWQHTFTTTPCSTYCFPNRISF